MEFLAFAILFIWVTHLASAVSQLTKENKQLRRAFQKLKNNRNS